MSKKAPRLTVAKRNFERPMFLSPSSFPARAVHPPLREEYEVVAPAPSVEPALVPEHSMLESFRRIPRSLGEKPEVKYYNIYGNIGAFTANTWASVDPFTSIVAGVAQNQRLGRVIHLIKGRFVLYNDFLSSGDIVAVSAVMKADVSVTATDLFSGNAATGAALDYPNPAMVDKVYHHKVFTPFMIGYGDNDNVVVLDLPLRGKLLYDASGNVQGPAPSVLVVTNNALAPVLRYAWQVWYTDA